MANFEITAGQTERSINGITQEEPRSPHHFLRSVIRWLILATLVWFVVMLIVGNSTGHFEDNCLRAGIVIFSLWACLFFVAVLRYIWKESQIAFTPIPTPAEIEAQLRAHLGRQPTIDEIYAMQQMIKTRRNEGLLGLGAVFGGLYLGGHLFKGR